jgi:hypothetical protein
MPPLMKGLLARWLPAHVDAALAETIGWCIDQVEPRLHQAGGHPGRYTASIRHAMAYCHDLANRVPGPVELSRHAFTQDPLVHSLFGSPEGIVQALASSQPVREWQHGHPGGGEVYAFLGVRLQERNILGMESQGEHLQKEVPQKVVYFSDHTFSGPAESAEAARALLERRFLGSLLTRIKLRTDVLRERKQQLEQQRDEVRAKLRCHQDDGPLQASLEATLKELAETVEALDLRRYASYFDDVLLHPEDYLRLDGRSFCLDAMGICRPETSGNGALPVNWQEMTCRDQRRWGVMMVRLQLDELPPYQERLEVAERWLAI